MGTNRNFRYCVCKHGYNCQRADRTARGPLCIGKPAQGGWGVTKQYRRNFITSRQVCDSRWRHLAAILRDVHATHHTAGNIVFVMFTSQKTSTPHREATATSRCAVRICRAIFVESSEVGARG